ncbi:RPL9, partial [Symbiodinium sp. CCMP2456]
VKGKHGELKRDFKHLPIELFLSDGGKKVVARMYFAKSKQCSMLNSVCSHISNLFEGVAHKFEYKMRLVYAHFPINANIINGGKTIEIRNFLGEKVVRTVHMLPGVTVEKSASTKDELVVCGADIELTGQSAALIHQSCLCKKKDIRKFLDGIYVSSHGVKED